MKKFLLSLAAFVAMSAAAQTYVVNDDVENGSTMIGWGGSMKISVVEENGGHCYAIEQPAKSANNWEVQVAYDTESAYVVGTEYTFEMDIKGSVAGTTFSAGFQNTDGYKGCGDFGNVNVTTEWQHVKLTTKCTGEGAKRFVVSVGDYVGTLYVDNVKIYSGVIEEEPETPAESAAVVLWEGDALCDDWGNQPNLLSDGGAELEAAGAKAGDVVRFYITPTDTYYYIEIVEGHWNGTYANYSNDKDAVEKDNRTYNDLSTGYVTLELTQEILDKVIGAKQGWGGTFIGNGDNTKITKIEFVAGGADSLDKVATEAADAVAYDLFGNAGATKGFMVKGGKKVYVK